VAQAAHACVGRPAIHDPGLRTGLCSGVFTLVLLASAWPNACVNAAAERQDLRSVRWLLVVPTAAGDDAAPFRHQDRPPKASTGNPV
jgi:hypothetical protein